MREQGALSADDEFQRVFQRNAFLGSFRLYQPPACGFTDQENQEGNQQSGQTNEEEGKLPPFTFTDHWQDDRTRVHRDRYNPSTDDIGKARADRYAECVDAERPGERLLLEIVRDDGIGRW